MNISNIQAIFFQPPSMATGLLCPTDRPAGLLTSGEQPEDTENRKQLALQGLHISGLSQCAPKYSCPSCPISSSETSGSFLPPSHPSSACLNHSSPLWPGPHKPYYSHQLHGYSQEGGNREDMCSKTEGGGEEEARPPPPLPPPPLALAENQLRKLGGRI